MATAQQNTAPHTAQAQHVSRFDALKHGILASQAVISTIEGHEKRKVFEAIVDGLAQDFQPVGTYEQLLVQEIAACFWRTGRLLSFEGRASFQDRDRPVTQLVNHPYDHDGWKTALYLQGGKLVTTEQVYDAAGLSGIMLPNEADTNRIIRYGAAINRTRERAVKSLRENRTARRGMANPRAEVAPAVDRAAARRNASRQDAILLAPLFSIEFWKKLAEVQKEADQAREAELREQLHGQDRETDPETDQTKPKTLTVDEVRRRIYLAIHGCEMPEDPPTEPEKPSADPEKPKTDPDKPPST